MQLLTWVFLQLDKDFSFYMADLPEYPTFNGRYSRQHVWWFPFMALPAALWRLISLVFPQYLTVSFLLNFIGLQRLFFGIRWLFFFFFFYFQSILRNLLDSAIEFYFF